MLAIFALSAALSVAQQDTSNAYLDPHARELVAQVRERRELVDRSITRYQALAKERISMGLRTRLRDRLFYRRETASRIDWRRGGPINITVLGAREAVPVVTPKVSIPTDLKNFLPRLAFDPMDTEALMRVDTTTLKNPLATGGEANYRYRTGDSTTINLGDRKIKLIELEVIPRRSEFQLITGSFWIDSDTHSIVQVTFRPSRPFDLERDSDDEDDRREARRMPGFLKPIRADLEYVTLEYGLMHLRWWMPRLIAVEGYFQMGSLKTPLNYERSYEQYDVEGDTVATLVSRKSMRNGEVTDSAGTVIKPCRPGMEMNVSVDIDDKPPTAQEQERQRQRAEEQRERQRQRQRARTQPDTTAPDTARERRRREREECAKLYNVTIADSAKLLSATELPQSFYESGEVLTSDEELQKLAKQLGKLADPPWEFRRPSFAWGPLASGMFRYNKVEALSMGARTNFDFGRLALDGTGRIGIADLEPNGEIGLARNGRRSSIRLAGYRRLDVMDKASGFGGISSTLDAFFFGNDDRAYYRSLGGELIVRPADARPQWFDLRLFAEKQRAASTETDFSIAHVVNEDHLFLPNLKADRADEAGAALTLRWAGGQNPAKLRGSVELHADASTGTFDFTRESATLYVGTPLPLHLAGAVEVSAGTSTGPVPIQSLWYLGGIRSMRGYSIDAASGTAFWRARAEIGTGLPMMRLTGFTDFGWAGDRTDVRTRASMLSVGAGASFLDGLLRIDLARSLRGQRDWKLHASVDGIL